MDVGSEGAFSNDSDFGFDLILAMVFFLGWIRGYRVPFFFSFFFLFSFAWALSVFVQV